MDEGVYICATAFFLPLMLFVFRRVVLNYLGLSFCPGFGAISTNKLAKHM